MADTYTHKDLASLCSVSETTIKSYRRKFPGFIPVLTRGKPIRFKKEAGDVCLKIRDCFDKGMSVRETTKVLKENFKEERVAPPKATRSAAPAAPSGVVTEEYLEKFFATAGQMMQGMASMATAQAKSAHRLEKLEAAVETLIELETRNSELYSQLLTSQPAAQTAPSSSAAPTAPPEPAPAAPTSEGKTEKVRARKIVNVTSPKGDVKSYALEKEEVPVDMPPKTLLDTPIVVLNNQGEFLGVPGRLSLSGFVEVLAIDAKDGMEALTNWKQENSHWIFSMETIGGDAHDFYFTGTTTPKGNQVALLDRLDVNDRKTSPQFLQEFFRQIKDKV